MRESEIEKQLVAHVESLGGLALKVSVANARGFPDRLILLPNGRAFFCELKKEDGGTTSPQQLSWMNRLWLLGYRVRICYGLHDAIKFLKE